jgi:hypothetical protein
VNFSALFVEHITHHVIKKRSNIPLHCYMDSCLMKFKPLSPKVSAAGRKKVNEKHTQLHHARIQLAAAQQTSTTPSRAYYKTRAAESHKKERRKSYLEMFGLLGGVCVAETFSHADFRFVWPRADLHLHPEPQWASGRSARHPSSAYTINRYKTRLPLRTKRKLATASRTKASDSWELT